jgi:hypothetical protein
MTFEEMKAQYCGKSIRKKPSHEEDDLQTRAVAWFDSHYHVYKKLLFHPSNGGKRNAIEAAKFKRMGVRPGVADLMLIIPNRFYPYMCIELKSKKGKQSEHQKDFQRIVELAGAKYVICRSLEEFIAVVTDYLK